MSEPRVYPIRVPSPFFEKDNNAYLVDAGDLVLVDTGIDTEAAFAALKTGVEQAGHRLEEISKIFLTHKHLDHFGLAHRVSALSHGEVFIHRDDALDVRKFDERHDFINGLYEQKMREWAVPQETIDMISMRSRLVKLGRSVAVTELADGQQLDVGDGKLEVIHTPGHTQGSVCYRLDHWLFSGDHLLPTYTPNIGATEVTAGGMLKKYRASLLKTRQHARGRVLPGHGDEINDPVSRIEEIMNHHQEREGRILEILKGASGRSVFEIAQHLFGEMRDHHVLLGAGEVYAHLESLVEDKLVKIGPSGLFVGA